MCHKDYISKYNLVVLLGQDFSYQIISIIVATNLSLKSTPLGGQYQNRVDSSRLKEKLCFDLLSPMDYIVCNKLGQMKDDGNALYNKYCRSTEKKKLTTLLGTYFLCRTRQGSIVSTNPPRDDSTPLQKSTPLPHPNFKLL